MKGNIFQYQSDGVFRQNQLVVNSSIRMEPNFPLSATNIELRESDTAGPGLFSFKSVRPQRDYGRASFDVRHRVFIGGSANLPYAFRLSPS